MDTLIKLNDELAIGSQPSPKDLEALQRHGFRSIVNLGHDGESPSQLQPDRERDEARRLGLKYAHIPLSNAELDKTAADRLAVVLTSLEKPVFVHRATRSGAVAGAMTGSGQASDEANDAAGPELGELERFVRSYIERRTSRERAVARATSATILTEWLNKLVAEARAGHVAETSAGAGHGREYAYLHYRTTDRRHSVVVFRPEGPHLRAFTFEDAPDEDVAELVDRVTHRRSVAS